VKVSKKMLLLMALALIVALAAGCGAQPAEETGGEEPAAVESVKIGLNYELSGAVATYGGNTVNGIELAAKEINENGGVLGGAQIELVKADNKSDAAEATNIQTKLITMDNVLATLGPATSTNTLAAIPVNMENEVPLLTTSATAEKVTIDEAGAAKDFAFRVCFIDPFQGNVGANFIFNSLQLKKAAVYVDTNSDYSKAIAEVFKTAYTGLGGEIIAEESYVDTDQDFKATLTRIKSANPDVVYLPGYYKNVGAIVKQARELGITVPFVGADGYDSPDLVALGGAENLNNVFFTNHYSSQDTDPAVQKFVEAYKAAYGTEPDAFAALGYDAMYLMADAVNRAGQADSIAIKDALAATKDFTGITGNLSMDEKHNPVKAAVILEMKDGKQTFREKVQP